MKTSLSTALNLLLIILMALSVVFAVIFYFGTSLYSSEAAFSEQISVLGWRLDTFLNWAFLLVGVGAAAAILFPLVQMVGNPSGSKKTLLITGMMILVFILAYAVASPEITKFPGYEKFFFEEGGMDPNQFAKYVDTGLWTVYLLAILAVAAILYSEVSKLFK